MSWHKPEMVKLVKAIGFKHDKTQQALMQEALNLLFAKYGEDQLLDPLRKFGRPFRVDRRRV